MKNQAKVVARTKQGEILKGFVNKDELEHFNDNNSLYVNLVSGGNSVGTYICQDQLEGLYLVKSFEGNKPTLPVRLYFDCKRIIKDNLSMISASAVVAILSISALIVLL